MLLALAFMLPPVAVLACLGLNRFVPTRWSAFGAAIGLALAALSLLGVRISGQSMQLLDRPWFDLTEQTVRLVLRLDLNSWPIALALLAGGGLMLASLGFALPADLRGFGGLPASLALLVTASLLSVANADPTLRPMAWMLVVFSAAIALRASSGLQDTDSPLIVALAGTIATLLLWATNVFLVAQMPASTISLVCLTIACLVMLGCAPFSAVAGAMSAAPAGIGGALLALGLPLVGGQTLLTIASEMAFPAQWRTALILLGVISVLACGAGALGAQQARRLLAWQHAAQLGVFLVAVGTGGPAIGILLCSTCATLVATLAIALMERRTGSDDLGIAVLQEPLLIPGLALLIAAATAIGLPGTGGFWMRAQLFGILAQQGSSWVIGPLLAGAMLLGLSYLAPLAIFWRAQGHPEAGRVRVALILPGVAAMPLLVLGVLPQLIGNTAPRPSLGSVLASAVAIVMLLALPMLLQQFPRYTPENTEEQPGSAALPSALAASLGWLAWVATPTAALNVGWEALLQGSQLLGKLLAQVEERYYLAGLTIALIVVVLVFI
jgi:formate hydrogenlyase subunit 3/multisubunit Na+/H+ antiporter MnhD subunit